MKVVLDSAKPNTQRRGQPSRFYRLVQSVTPNEDTNLMPVSMENVESRDKHRLILPRKVS
jgi:hypothetical protein